MTRTDWGVKMRYLLAADPSGGEYRSKRVDGRVHSVLGSDGYVCQQPDGRWSVSFSVTDTSGPFMTADAATPENVAALRAHCERAAQPFAAELLGDDAALATFFEHRTFGGEIVRCDTLAPAEWIALLGDAAHAVAPFTGEGINSALESAVILVGALRGGGGARQFDAERREDAHAAFDFAMRNRKIVSGTPGDRFANTVSNIVLSTLKKCGCIAATMEDYMLGAKAEGSDVWRYRDLMALDRSQRKCIYPCAECLFPLLCNCCGSCD